MVWDSPGFPSIAVPYDHTRDFFYSGHTGILFLFVIELRTARFYKTSYICAISLIYTMFILAGTRVHYSIDIAAALLYAGFFDYLTKLYVVTIDKVFSFPYYLGNLLVQKVKKKYFTKETEASQI